MWPFYKVHSIILQGKKNTKADVLVSLFSLTDHKIIGISVKASKTNFNQISRVTLSRFVNCLKLSEKIDREAISTKY